MLVFDNLLVMSRLLAGLLSEKVVLLPHVVLSRAVTILFSILILWGGCIDFIFI